VVLVKVDEVKREERGGRKRREKRREVE